MMYQVSKMLHKNMMRLTDFLLFYSFRIAVRPLLVTVRNEGYGHWRVM